MSRLRQPVKNRVDGNQDGFREKEPLAECGAASGEKYADKLRTAVLGQRVEEVRKLGGEAISDVMKAEELREVARELKLKMGGTQAGKILEDTLRELENPKAQTPADFDLLKAAKERNLDGVTNALERGANVHARDEFGKTAMVYAMGEDVFESLPWNKDDVMVRMLRSAMQEQVTARATDFGV
jgi:hypothetical protein